MDFTGSIHWLHSRRGGGEEEKEEEEEREDAQENELAGVMLFVVSLSLSLSLSYALFVNVGNFCGARIRERDPSIDLDGDS